MNVYFAVFKLLNLSLDGDIESNPSIQKTVQGSFHQGRNKFGETSGIHCACNSLFAICWSSIKRVSVWKSWDLAYILDHVLFKGINVLRSLSVTEFPETVRLGTM